MPEKDNTGKTSIYRDYLKHGDQLKNTLFEPKLFYLKPTISLVPIKLMSGVYKVLMNHVPSKVPDFKPYYTLLSHGLMSHTYSLLPEQIDPRFPLSIKPVAVYSSFKKHLTHAQILDLSTLAYANTGRKAFEWESAEPCIIQLSFVKEDKHENDPGASMDGLSLRFQTTDKYAYSWKKMDWPLGSKKHSYFLHRQTEQQGFTVLVAKATASPFDSPVDGSTLICLDIDSTLVNPALVVLSWYAMVSSYNSTLGQYIAKPCQEPRILYDTVWADDPSNLLVPTPDDMKSTTGSEDQDFDDSDSSQEVDASKIRQIKVFNPSKLAQYSIPDNVLDHMNHQAKLWYDARKLELQCE